MNSLAIFALSLYVLGHALVIYYYLDTRGYFPFYNKEINNNDVMSTNNNNDIIKEHINPDYTKAQSIYEFTVKDINGNDILLEKYKGNVLLIVNVASECGFTENHYKQLQELYEKYKNKGLKILAFPCNQFGYQEPGDNTQINEFIKSKGITFDIFEKIDVNGQNSHPLFNYLKYIQGGVLADFIKWNFTKFIIDRNGQPVERHGPTTDPLDLVESLEKYLL